MHSLESIRARAGRPVRHGEACAVPTAHKLYAIAGRCVMMDEPTHSIRVFAVWGNRDIKVDFTLQVVRRDPRISKNRLQELAYHENMPVFSTRSTDEDCERQARQHWQGLGVAAHEG